MRWIFAKGQPQMLDRPVLIGSEIFYRTAMTSKHPLALPKTAPTLDLIRMLSWYDEASYVESPKATPRRLKIFHDPSYVDIAFDAEATQRISTGLSLEFGIGDGDNPIFPGVIERASIACGAAVKAANLLTDGGIVHSPLGGAHHAQPARASGFGYFNDIVIGILTMLDNGLSRIAYIDIDAHHGDAVEAAFAYNPDVMTLSIHQKNCWPHSGIESNPDLGVFNIPVPIGFNDSEMAYVIQEIALPLLERFKADAIVIQAGADSLADDHMMELGLSNRAYFRAVGAFFDQAPRIWVTGGGGYNPWAVTRCWAGIWCVLNGYDPAEVPPISGEHALIESIRKWPIISEPPDNWLETLVDEERPGEIRETVRKTASSAV